MEPLIDTRLLWIAAGALLAVVSVLAAGHALLNKRNPRSALGWVALILLSPVIGILAYLFLGINRVHRRARKMRLAKFQATPSGPNTEPAKIVLQQAMCDGNAVECLLSNADILLAAKKAIKEARCNVFISVYIFEASGIGQEFIDDLASAVSRGVSVYVLLDGVGALYSLGRTRRKLKKIGVNVATFLPLMTLPPNSYFNLRNHRKILVVDERVAIVGGTNIRNGYLNREGAPSIRDMNFSFRGPLVAEICAVFLDDWQATTGVNIASAIHQVDNYDEPGSSACRVIEDGPDNNIDILSLCYQAAIGKAVHCVRVLSPYFLPPPEIVAAFQLAAVRGVRVEVVLPGVSNIPPVHWATRNMLSQLLRYGVQVYYQDGPFDHSKLLLVDDTYSLIGSANLDSRSLRLNFEIGVEIESESVSRELNSHVDKIISSAQKISQAEIGDRPTLVRLRDALAWLFTPYL